jgi:hypothetical protein
MSSSSRRVPGFIAGAIVGIVADHELDEPVAKVVACWPSRRILRTGRALVSVPPFLRSRTGLPKFPRRRDRALDGTSGLSVDRQEA